MAASTSSSSSSSSPPPPLPCYAALGVASTVTNAARRRAARDTWSANSSRCVKFLIRSKGLQAEQLRRLSQEANDIVYLPVDAHAKPIHARVVTLFAWLQLAPTHVPGASWICKADDDIYLFVPDWLQQLRLIEASREAAARAAGRSAELEAILHGKLLYHNLDTTHFMPKSFSFSFDAAGTEWQRAIRFAAGDQSSARSADERQRLEACRSTDPQACPEWCARVDECTGPFPYAAGWLVSLSTALSTALAHSADVKSDAERVTNTSRTWGPPVFEDIWLGAAIHRWLPPELHLTLVRMDDTHVFNGEWPRRCYRRMVRERRSTIPCNFEFNTTIVYHGGRAVGTRLVHAHLQRERNRHVQPDPALVCSDEANADGRASAATASATAGSERARLVGGVFKYARIRDHLAYIARARAGRGAYCALVEPRFLRRPEMSRLFRRPQVDLRDSAERARFGGAAAVMEG